MRIYPAAILLLLAGCAGKPTTYLALAPTQSPITAISTAATPIAVAHVSMPAAIDRLYLTSATGTTTLHVAAHARWVAPIDSQARTVLARDLASRIPDADILMPGDPVPETGARIVHVNVTEFLPRPGTVVLEADWRITSSKTRKTLANGRFHVEIPSGPKPAARAEAMSTALGRLADAIAARS